MESGSTNKEKQKKVNESLMKKFLKYMFTGKVDGELPEYKLTDKDYENHLQLLDDIGDLMIISKRKKFSKPLSVVFSEKQVEKILDFVVGEAPKANKSKGPTTTGEVIVEAQKITPESELIVKKSYTDTDEDDETPETQASNVKEAFTEKRATNDDKEVEEMLHINRMYDAMNSFC